MEMEKRTCINLSIYLGILVRLYDWYDWYDYPNTILLSDYLSCSTVRLCDCATVDLDVDINKSE